MSVRRIDSSVKLIESASEASFRQLMEMQSFLEDAEADKVAFERKVSDV